MELIPDKRKVIGLVEAAASVQEAFASNRRQSLPAESERLPCGTSTRLRAGTVWRAWRAGCCASRVPRRSWQRTLTPSNGPTRSDWAGHGS